MPDYDYVVLLKGGPELDARWRTPNPALQYMRSGELSAVARTSFPFVRREPVLWVGSSSALAPARGERVVAAMHALWGGQRRRCPMRMMGMRVEA